MTPPEEVGKYLTAMDTALPGIYIYVFGTMDENEASVLAQLQMGMSRLNGCLHRIGAA